MLKKFFLTFVALVAMTVVASAKSYTGTVSNIVMGTKTPANMSGVTFDVTDDVLSGNFDIPTTVSHHLTITALLNVTGTTFDGTGEGTVTVYTVAMPFTAELSEGELTSTTLVFHCEAVTSGGVVAEFDFEGTADN